MCHLVGNNVLVTFLCSETWNWHKLCLAIPWIISRCPLLLIPNYVFISPYRFIIYKLPKYRIGTDGSGVDYMYLDSSVKNWQMSKFIVNVSQGAIGNTLNQLYMGEVYKVRSNPCSFGFSTVLSILCLWSNLIQFCCTLDIGVDFITAYSIGFGFVDWILNL